MIAQEKILIHKLVFVSMLTKGVKKKPVTRVVIMHSVLAYNTRHVRMIVSPMSLKTVIVKKIITGVKKTRVHHVVIFITISFLAETVTIKRISASGQGSCVEQILRSGKMLLEL